MLTSGAAITADESGAFVKQFLLEPTSTGPLDGLTFAVKDIIDVAGRITGCGNPSWQNTHPAAASHAVCVEQLLAAGARCLGKTVTDELAFSLIGENHFYGTPLNPRAPERVPGGSSSGSASAVACGLVDFALGTDTGGSVRVPASNCGVYGLRPSHGIVSVAGVMPFAPTFDTVGVLARDAATLARAGGVLLGIDVSRSPHVGTVHVIREAFGLCDQSAKQALQSPLYLLRQLYGERVRETSLREIDGEPAGTRPLLWYDEIYRVLQWAEIWSSHGAWVQSAHPEFGPITTRNFELTRTLDRRSILPAIRRRELFAEGLASFLGPDDLLCIPTAPSPAPRKGTVGARDQDSTNYYPQALTLTSLAGVGRLPQVSLPLALCDGAPLGLSLLAGRGQDGFLLGVVQSVSESLPQEN